MMRSFGTILTERFCDKAKHCSAGRIGDTDKEQCAGIDAKSPVPKGLARGGHQAANRSCPMPHIALRPVCRLVTAAGQAELIPNDRIML